MGRIRKALTVYMDDETHDWLRRVSRERKIPGAEIVRAGIELALERLDEGDWLWNEEGDRLTRERRGVA